jgi:hypothetical protein
MINFDIDKAYEESLLRDEKLTKRLIDHLEKRNEELEKTLEEIQHLLNKVVR